MQIVAAGMHEALVHRGVVEACALLHRQGIEIHPQSHQRHARPSRRAQLGQHAGAAHAFAHLPAPAAQFASHQGRGLLFVATELGMAVDVAAQLDQLRQGCRQGCFEPKGLPAHHDSRAKNCSRAATGFGGQRRVCSSHSPWR